MNTLGSKIIVPESEKSENEKRLDRELREAWATKLRVEALKERVIALSDIETSELFEFVVSQFQIN